MCTCVCCALFNCSSPPLFSLRAFCFFMFLLLFRCVGSLFSLFCRGNPSMLALYKRISTYSPTTFCIFRYLFASSTFSICRSNLTHGRHWWNMVAEDGCSKRPLRNNTIIMLNTNALLLSYGSLTTNHVPCLSSSEAPTSSGRGGAG